MDLIVTPPAQRTVVESAPDAGGIYVYRTNFWQTNLITLRMQGRSEVFHAYKAEQVEAIIIRPAPGADRSRIYAELTPGLYSPVADIRGTNGSYVQTNPPATIRVMATSVATNGIESGFSDVATGTNTAQKLSIVPH